MVTISCKGLIPQSAGRGSDFEKEEPGPMVTVVHPGRAFLGKQGSVTRLEDVDNVHVSGETANALARLNKGRRRRVSLAASQWKTKVLVAICPRARGLLLAFFVAVLLPERTLTSTPNGARPGPGPYGDARH